MLAMKKPGSCAWRRAVTAREAAHVRARAVGKHHAVGDLAGKRDHALAQGGKDDRRQRADAVMRAQLRRRSVRTSASGLPGVTPMRTCAGAWLTPMPRRKRPARDLVHEGGALREIAHRAGIDRRDRGGEGDALGDVAQRLAQRHVGKHAGRVNAGEAAPLDFACDLERGPPPAGHGDQADGRKLLRACAFPPILPLVRGPRRAGGPRALVASFCRERMFRLAACREARLPVRVGDLADVDVALGVRARGRAVP